MPAGNQRGRGFRGGPRGGGDRGSPVRGRGAHRGRGRGRGRGGGRGGYHTLEEMEQMYMPFEIMNRDTASPRGRRAGQRGKISLPNSGANTPTRSRGSPRGRGRGDVNDYQSPRGRGRGRGGSKLRPDAPLSGLLYQERPFLRPVIFVPSVYTKTLFEEEEEILQAVVEEVGETEQSQVPTADRVFRVFSGNNMPPMFSSASEDGHDEELEEIDFSDISKLLDVPSRPNSTMNIDMAVVEEKFTGFFIDTAPTPVISDPTVAIDDTPTPLATTSPASVIRQSIEETKALDQEVVRPNDVTPVNTKIVAKLILDEPFVSDSNTDDISAPVAFDPLQVLSGDGRLSSPKQGEPGFYIDTEPARIDSPHLSGDLDINIEEDEEVIVYVAPHPRSGRLTPAPSEHTANVTSLPSTSILTGTLHPPTPSSPVSSAPQAHKPSMSNYKSNLPPPSTPIPPAPAFESISFSFSNSPAPNKQPRHAPVFTTRAKSKAQLKQRQREARAIRKRVERQAVFGSFGAIMSEAQLRGGNPKRDPRWGERRQDDSDVDWGDEDVEEGEGKEATGMAEGMDLDPDLVMEMDAMKSFAAGMSQEGDRFVTMDDIADEERMRAEDEDTRDVGSSGDDEEDENTGDDEVDAVINAEENMMLAEFGDIADFSDDDDESDEDDSDDEGHSPRTGFQARLERLRNRTRGKRPRDTRHISSDDDSDDGDDDDAFMSNLTWAEQDEDFIAHIEMLIDDNDSVLSGRDRKERNKLFRAVRDGTFADIDGFTPARKNKDKYKDLPVELQEQWQKDREKKAERRRAREMARLEAAADPLFTKKGGKKGRKAMLATAKLDPTITVLPNRVIDMVTLVQQIRRFITNVGGPSTMSLPPTNKATRKSIHEMALAFNLKSQSKGKGDSRYTTLSKTTRSGYGINEQKIAKLVRRNGAWGGEFAGSSGGRDRGQGRPIVPKHRDGDEVGKAAPKIGQSNIGFRMLASMGWSEGDRIGVTGGLDAPLTAVIKNTKLGLGANK